MAFLFLGHSLKPFTGLHFSFTRMFRDFFTAGFLTVLFEIATAGSGFSVDENAAHLDEALKLPSWFEESREQVEKAAPPVNFIADNYR